MSWQRARSEAQKAERLRAIEEAAGRLFLERPYHQIGMADIAAIAGFTRPNLYRYFSSKEEIFLSLLGNDLEGWIEALENSRPSPTGADGGNSGREEERAGIERFVDWWVATFEAQPRLARLLPLLSFSLEENSGEDTLRAFKHRLAVQVDRIGTVVRRELPWYRVEWTVEFSVTNLALVSGLKPMATRGETHERVLREPALEPFAVRFSESYKSALTSWLIGKGRAS